MNKKGLFSKMVATYTIIIVLSFVIIAAFLSFWFEGYYFGQRKKQLDAEAQLIAVPAVQYLNRDITYEKFKERLIVFSNYIKAEIWLVDSYGYISAVSNSKYEELEGRQIPLIDLEELRLRHTFESKGLYGNLFKIPVHTYAVPISYNGAFIGAIVMNTSIDEIKEKIIEVYKIIWISAIFAIIVSSAIIYYFSQKFIIKPLGQINAVAKKIAKGEVNKRVKIKSTDEIGELVESFNYMADNLEKVDKKRREFISNVSHELRSPITSIKGFIGGILDGIIPKEKENYYLTIAYEEIQRLTRLINDLLDLSTMESGNLSFNKVKVDINELIRLVVIKFEQKIMNKSIKVDVYFEEDRTIVVTDRDRIIQVVTNLFDNAIKYVNENGIIKIGTKIKGNKIHISIFNNGDGIPQEELNHIWDRFYKIDKSRTSKLSTGLGLPIVRNILTQLGEDIWIENKPLEGVTFTFTLQRNL